MTNRTDSHRQRRHSYHPLYFAWRNMRACCGVIRGRHAHDAKAYAGISVCSEWRDNYRAFEAWGLAHGWQSGMCLIRRDKTGDFCPENCGFGTRAELRATYRDVHRFDGKTLRDILGFGAENPRYSLALNRITKFGWDVADACAVPAGKAGINFGGRFRAKAGGMHL